MYFLQRVPMLRMGYGWQLSSSHPPQAVTRLKQSPASSSHPPQAVTCLKHSPASSIRPPQAVTRLKQSPASSSRPPQAVTRLKQSPAVARRIARGSHAAVALETSSKGKARKRRFQAWTGGAGQSGPIGRAAVQLSQTRTRKSNMTGGEDLFVPGQGGSHESSGRVDSDPAWHRHSTAQA